MREIKFRAWDKKEKTMLFLDFNVLMQQNEIESMYGNWTPDLDSIMQFTGLHDKNGKEIYEGDICKYMLTGFEKNKTIIVPVEIVPEIGTGHYLRFEGTGYICLNPSTVDMYNIKVIGNIYENPELLEKGAAE